MSATPRRGGTATSSFGVSRREGHDASAFYERFSAPEISRDSEISAQARRNQLWVGDARDMDAYGDVADNSVALVVTSPPYFAGKEYEETVGEGHVPASYKDYLQMLRDVFAECKRKLEPGGRIAVNVANLGRKPYRSLSSDVIGILQDDLGLLLRGEVIWRKHEGAAGNCAWGSFQLPSNPVLRDLTERIVIASKGRFDRARSAAQRASEQLPYEGTAPVDEFMEATTDVWEIQPESATRIGHPAPFPVELPERLIHLYTYRRDLVLDPFMGSGTTALAAMRTGRFYVGFDTDSAYKRLAERRIDEERNRPNRSTAAQRLDVRVLPSANGKGVQSRLDGLDDAASSAGASSGASAGTTGAIQDNFQARAGQQGQKAQQLAREVLQRCGFTITGEKVLYPGGVEVNFEARDRRNRIWLFDVSGAFVVTRRPGLRRTDTLWKALGRAAVLHETTEADVRLVLLTTDRPARSGVGSRALMAMSGEGKAIHDVIELLDEEDLQRLAQLASGENLSG